MLASWLTSWLTSNYHLIDYYIWRAGGRFVIVTELNLRLSVTIICAEGETVPELIREIAAAAASEAAPIFA